MLDFTDSHLIAVRRHATAIAGRLGLKRDKDFSAHTFDWKTLNSVQADTLRAARDLADKITDSMPESEARCIEECHDVLLHCYEVMEQEKDIRSQIGDRGARADGRNPFSRAPKQSDVEQGPIGSSDYMESDLNENPQVPLLRSGQSMVEHVRTNRFQGGDTLRGLTEGAFFRAMVTGAQNDIERRALAEGSDSAGGYTVPTILEARLIDRLRAASVVFRAGAVTMPLSSDHHTIAKVATDPVPAWRLENAAIAESEPTFSQVQLVPRMLAVMVKVSRELLEDSVNLGTALPNIIASAMAAELDRVALLGTGTAPQPRGVINFVGKTSTTVTAGALTYGKLLAARTALRGANSDVTAYIMSSRDEGLLSGLTDTTGQPLNIPPAIANVPMLATTALPLNLGTGTDEAPVFAGDWSKLLIGLRAGLRIEVLRERYADVHQYAFVAHLRADIAAEHESAFTVFNVTDGS